MHSHIKSYYKKGIWQKVCNMTDTQIFIMNLMCETRKVSHDQA